MAENGHLIGQTLKQFFPEGSVAYHIRRLGVKGMVPLEVPIEEILDVAREKGFNLGGFRKESEGMFWIQPKEESKVLVLPTKLNPDGRETVWLFDNDVDYFMDLFLR